jgi:spermidine/putrescine transport system permease protein
VGDRQQNRAGKPMSRKSYLWAGYTVLYIAALYAPVAFLIIFAFNDSTAIAFPLSGVTTRWFSVMANSPGLIDALVNSLKVSSAVAVISTVLGTVAAKALSRAALPGRPALMGMLTLPLLIPGIVMGIALLIVAGAIGLQLSLVTIAIAHVVYTTPFAILIMLPRFEGFDRNLEEASRDLGEGLFFTFIRVVLPLAAPGIVSSLLLTFTVSLDEFVLTFFLAGNETTLPLYIWSQLRFPGKLPGVLALSACILCFSFFLVTLAEWVRRLGTPANPQ